VGLTAKELIVGAGGVGVVDEFEQEGTRIKMNKTDKDK